MVIGTTGWHDHSNEILELFRNRKSSCVYGSNFSIGAQVFFRIVRRAARLMNGFPAYDVGIHELHHNQKIDAPSGTARTIGNILLSYLQRKSVLRSSNDGHPIRPEQLDISSSRIGKIFGTHSVLFQSETDEIELIHRVHNRSGFAGGAVYAAELIREFTGIYSFEELVFEKTIHSLS
jgi:4-hydroxy-tetrahydrodipicolinate reductase